MISFMRRWNQRLEIDDAICRATADLVHRLDDDDEPALRALIARDPVAHCYVESMIDERGGISTRWGSETGMFLGIWDLNEPDQLKSACWVGSNIVPVEADADDAFQLGRAIASLNRRYGSIFGPAVGVLGIWEQLAASGRYRSRSVREDQPLMVTTAPAPIPGSDQVVLAQVKDFSIVLPASVAMFTEELGYSPLLNGGTSYPARVKQLIRSGNCMIQKYQPAPGEPEEVMFKADFGVVTDSTVQIQGVWLHPKFRGQGRAAAAMSTVIDQALTMAPNVSLYVNEFNTAAVKTYEKTGFTQKSTFATVLF